MWTSNYCLNLLYLSLHFLSLNGGVQQANGISRAFLDVYLRVEPVDDFCGVRRCNITYAISVLTKKQFDLHILMLQDGQMTRRRRRTLAEEGRPYHRQMDYFFEENTVVRLSDEARNSNGAKVYLGVLLFDLPDDIQGSNIEIDYFLVEVTNVIKLGWRAKTEFSSDTVSIGTRVYRLNEPTPLDANLALASNGQNESDSGGPSMKTKIHQRNGIGGTELGTCVCENRNCGCCEHVTVRKIHLDDEVCVNVSYISADIGVRLALSVDNHIYYSKELSLRNPPPACFEVPHLREYASICIRLYNLKLKDKELTGCIEMEAILLHLRIAQHQIGCFRIPI